MPKLITFKLNTSVIPNFDKMTELERAKAIANSVFIVGPYSVSFEKAFNAYTSGYYKKQNQELLERYHIPCGATPIIATVTGGTKVTEEELKFFCFNEAYTSLVTEVRNGCIMVVDTEGNIYDADTLQGYAMEGGGGGGGGEEENNGALVYYDEEGNQGDLVYNQEGNSNEGN